MLAVCIVLQDQDILADLLHIYNHQGSRIMEWGTSCFEIICASFINQDWRLILHLPYFDLYPNSGYDCELFLEAHYIEYLALPAENTNF